jgi:protein-tyrosine phosphatase
MVTSVDASRIINGLSVGSAPPPGNYSRRFDVIYFVADEYQPPAFLYPGVTVRKFPFNDTASPSQRDIRMAWNAAEAAAQDVAAGRRVLVTCAMGRNRSALVAAIAVHLLTGVAGKKAGALVAARRVDPTGVPALSNKAFRQFLTAL